MVLTCLNHGKTTFGQGLAMNNGVSTWFWHGFAMASQRTIWPKHVLTCFNHDQFGVNMFCQWTMGRINNLIQKNLIRFSNHRGWTICNHETHVYGRIDKSRLVDYLYQGSLTDPKKHNVAIPVPSNHEKGLWEMPMGLSTAMLRKPPWKSNGFESHGFPTSDSIEMDSQKNGFTLW